ncbi:PRC-barrel domain containing protein [Paratractidigestivibacter sp.]|uniref:PRC-barrel domain-containing protein n=1 Tax=Paratractidigestivibacter sp. TaxID=2847316 RepID=UPI002AC937F5|nr:PRC-barrel domain containing protein [Paratractidigestivibacter sp.]
MLKVNDLYGRKVYVPKKSRKKDVSGEVKLSRLGKVSMAVFSPDGREVVGFIVRRPDIAGMVKRTDAFLATDSFKLHEDGTLLVTREDGLDDAARERMAHDWDTCVMWAGMDAKTAGGKNLGYVSDAEFDLKTGAVSKFYVGDGGVARAIVGSFEIPATMVRGYSKGYMVVDNAAADLELDGGVAAKAGESYAAAKVKGAEAAQKAGKAAGEAVDKGSYAFGRMLGKAKRAIEDATSDEEDAAPSTTPAIAAADVRVSEPVEKLRAAKDEAANEEPKVFAPKPTEPAKVAAPAKKASAKATPAKKPAAKSASASAVKAAGKQIGRMGKMFSSFKDEFEKASK